MPAAQQTSANQKPTFRYAVQESTVCEGWTPFGIVTENGVDRPCSYHSLVEAAEDVLDFFSDIQNQVADGSRDADDGYDPDTFRIIDGDSEDEYGFEFVGKKLHLCYPDGNSTSIADIK